jgi:hypothetical protein
MQPVVKKSPAFAVGGLVVGGVLMIVGPLLTWFDIEVAGGRSLALSGTDSSVGNGVLSVGVAVVVLRGDLARASKTGGRGWSIAALVFAISALPFATSVAFEPEAVFPAFAAESFSEEFSVSRGVAQAEIEGFIDSGEISASPGVGSYVATLGALLAVVGAILGIAWAKKLRGELVPPAATAARRSFPPAAMPPQPGQPEPAPSPSAPETPDKD